MGKRLCVYTCITGDYDDLHEIKNPEKNIDYICFTNNQTLKSATWKIIQIRNEGLPNQLLSRKIKILGHPLISKNYDLSVWMDASVVWDQSIEDFVKCHLKEKPFAAFKHHARSNIHEEALACLTFRKDTKENLLYTIKFLDNSNFPDNLGLYEMTVFIKQHNNPIVIQAMHTWFTMVSNYSKRDQLSFMYALWQTNLPVTTINLNIWDNKWFHNAKHSISSPPLDAIVCYHDYNSSDQLGDYYSYTYNRQNNIYSFSTTIPTNTSTININPFNTIGLFYKIIATHPSSSKISVRGSLEYNSGNISCTEFNLIQLKGSFKKGQKLSFSMETKTIDELPINDLLDCFWRQNNTLISRNNQLSIDLKRANQDNKKLQNDLSNILNSKGWRTLNKLRNIMHPFKQTN